MNQSPKEIQPPKNQQSIYQRYASIIGMWIARLTLVVSASVMSYVVTRPSYNYAHWIPHAPLRNLGIPYSALLWFESHADWLLHFFGGALLTFLLAKSHLGFISAPLYRPLLLACLICLSAELVQLSIGRGLDITDLLLGILGSFMAYSAINKNKQMPS